MSTLANVALVIGYITSVTAFITVAIKLFRKLKDIMNGQLCELRSDITSIYYRHCDEANPTIREYERKNLDALYAAYEAQHGNTFVKDIYAVMRTWKVVT